jgi:hypothetical protein
MKKKDEEQYREDIRQIGEVFVPLMRAYGLKNLGEAIDFLEARYGRHLTFPELREKVTKEGFLVDEGLDPGLPPCSET